MHLLLTDRLTCPRCGPEFGLILLAERMGGERRVRDGVLGCPNCRDAFPVADGFGDLRAPPRGDLPAGRAGSEPSDDDAHAERLQALLGVVEGPGTLALVGASAAHAAAVARRVEGVEVMALDADTRHWPEAPRLTRLTARPGIPLTSRTLRGVVVDGTLGDGWVVESCRVVASKGRVVVENANEATVAVLEGAGLSVLAAEPGTVVAARA
ncbi:MAG: hypothetical protein RJQ04_05530 [Longimicrobiales bacterium]